MSPRDQISNKLIVISPAKDESAYIERTIESVLAQTVRPYKWIIVDDGSCDETPAIIQRYAREHEWIVPVSIHRDAERRPGSAEIRAFYTGYELVRDDLWDFVVKLDTDLELPSDYFERMLAGFERDAHLGIASGIYLEERSGSWNPVEMPPYHAAGASKIVRRECFLEMDGFPLMPGWDTADEIKAHARGWKTGHFREITFRHLRPEGSAIGSLRTNVLHGRIYYVCGGGPLFLLVKTMHRMLTGKPLIVGACGLVFGYLQALFSKQTRIVSDAEASFYRKLLSRQMAVRLGRLVPFLKVN